MGLTAADATSRPAGSELAGMLRVPFDVAAEGIGLIEGVHMGVARRAFGSTGAFGRPARAGHDAIAGFVYAALRKAAVGAGRAASAAVGQVLPPDGQEVSRSRRGGNLVAAVNGIVGDRLAAEDNPAAVRMALRVNGRDVHPTPESLAGAYAEAGPAIALFLHGLCGNEHSWTPPDSPELGFPGRLNADLGYTPVLVRYNSGLHVSENGQALARLLGELSAAWPVEPTAIVLIGHSMGGLVARSACHYGRQEGAAWTALVRHTICLGSPHLGAPLEKAVNVATNGLGLLPETRAFAAFLNQRSVGIKDLRYGSIVDEDWLDREPDAFLQDHCRPIDLLPDADHHAVAATLTQDAGHPVGYLLGDLLVRFRSATGQHGRRRLGFSGTSHVGGIHHLHLLHHPQVYSRIHSILQTG